VWAFVISQYGWKVVRADVTKVYPAEGFFDFSKSSNFTGHRFLRFQKFN